MSATLDMPPPPSGGYLGGSSFTSQNCKNCGIKCLMVCSKCKCCEDCHDLINEKLVCKWL